MTLPDLEPVNEGALLPGVTVELIHTIRLLTADLDEHAMRQVIFLGTGTAPMSRADAYRLQSQFIMVGDRLKEIMKCMDANSGDFPIGKLAGVELHFILTDAAARLAQAQGILDKSKGL